MALFSSTGSTGNMFRLLAADILPTEYLRPGLMRGCLSPEAGGSAHAGGVVVSWKVQENALFPDGSRLLRDALARVSSGTVSSRSEVVVSQSARRPSLASKQCFRADGSDQQGSLDETVCHPWKIIATRPILIVAGAVVVFLAWLVVACLGGDSDGLPAWRTMADYGFTFCCLRQCATSGQWLG